MNARESSTRGPADFGFFCRAFDRADNPSDAPMPIASLSAPPIVAIFATNPVMSATTGGKGQTLQAASACLNNGTNVNPVGDFKTAFSPRMLTTPSALFFPYLTSTTSPR